MVLGHGHPGLAAVIADQAKTLIHTSNLYFHPLQGQLAARLAALSGLQRTFFCNSGTEAVEACLKFARRYWFSKGDKNRTQLRRARAWLLGTDDGRALGDGERELSRAVRAADPRRHVCVAGRSAALEAAVTSTTAAIIAEPIQGEGGVRPLSPEFAAAIARVTKQPARC